jgi:hypothetical protein
MRCLAKDPDARPQTAAQLVAELDALVTMSGDFSASGRIVRRRTPLVAGIGAVVVIAGLTVYAWERGRDTPPVPAPIVVAAAPALTHADSEAIANAVDKKIAERRTADARTDSVRRARADSASPKAGKAATPATPAAPVMDMAAMARANDSLRKEMMREVFDSVAKMQALAAGVRGRIPALAYIQSPEFDSLTRRTSSLSAQAFATRAATLGPPRRVFVSVPQSHPMNPVAMAAAVALMDSLRTVLSRNPRYHVISRDSSSSVLSRTRVTDSISKQLDVELFASLQWAQATDGHVTWQLTVRDLGAHSAYTSRMTSARVAPDSIGAASDSLIAKSVRALSDLDHAPRKVVVTR